jgi:integrase
MKRALTDASIRAAVAPANGRIELVDPACRGLSLRVTASGVRSFAFRYRPRGSSHIERITIGRYPDVALRDARAQADKLRAQVAAGKNPSAHKREAPARSFAGLAGRYITEHARRFKRSAAKDERNLRLHILPRWGERDFTAISRSDVIALIEKLVTAGKPTLANHVHRLVSGIFNFAMDVDLTSSNPASRLRKRGVERAKTRVLADDEIRLFWSRIAEPPIPRAVGLALRLVLITGVRPGEAAGMERGELEYDERGQPTGWTIPPARSKNRRPHFVPLSPLARDIIAEAMALADGSPFVFASHGKYGHATNFDLAKGMALLPTLVSDEAGAASWKADVPTAHDLRRTCATRLAATGTPAEDVSAILGHARSDITGRVYDQYRRADEKRRALDRWSRLLSAIVSGKDAANVVALRP